MLGIVNDIRNVYNTEMYDNQFYYIKDEFVDLSTIVPTIEYNEHLEDLDLDVIICDPIGIEDQSENKLNDIKIESDFEETEKDPNFEVRKEELYNENIEAEQYFKDIKEEESGSNDSKESFVMAYEDENIQNFPLKEKLEDIVSKVVVTKATLKKTNKKQNLTSSCSVSESGRYNLRPRKNKLFNCIYEPQNGMAEKFNVKVYWENISEVGYLKSEESENLKTIPSDDNENTLALPSSPAKELLFPSTSRSVKNKIRKRARNVKKYVKKSKKTKSKVQRKRTNLSVIHKTRSKIQVKKAIRKKQTSNERTINRRVAILPPNKVQLVKHANEKKFSCSACNYSSKQKSMVRLHIRRHLADKPYKCCICDYESVEKSHLVRHRKIHTGERPHKCSLCTYSSIQKLSLNKHLLRCVKRELHCH